MTTPAGWYDDGRGALRWWDGSQWTEHTHAPDAAPPGIPSLPAVPRAKRRSLWLMWVALGVFAVGSVIAASIYLPMLIVGAIEDAAQPGAADEQAAIAAVQLYDDAWDEADCDKYMQSTTESYREFLGLPDCESFEESATFFADSTDDYVIEITGVEHDGDSIVITTTETYQAVVDESGEPLSEPEQVEEHYTYVLVPVDGGWAIDDADSS